MKDMVQHSQRLRPLFAFALIAFSVYALSFTNATPLAAKAGSDSELTLLMREMYDDAAKMKTAVNKRKKVVPSVNHELMLKAAATEPEKVASPAYAALAQAYLKALNSLQEGSPADAPALYKNLIDSCMSCHSAFCPGPKTRIKNLY
jgi:hypothetical protein